MAAVARSKNYSNASEARFIARKAGITVHHNTSVYINRNEVELSLGTNIEVYPRSIRLTYS